MQVRQRKFARGHGQAASVRRQLPSKKPAQRRALHPPTHSSSPISAMEGEPAAVVTAAQQRRSSAGDGGAAAPSVAAQLDRVLSDMEELGILTSLAGKIVGGVAMTQSYYQHVLQTEGRSDEVPACQLLITHHHGHAVSMLPATQEQLQEQGHAVLPREAPVLSKVMSAAALSELHWGRVPAVVLFGCFVADADELEDAAAAGIPISPSMMGPHPEEHLTQMEVFFKQFTYPEHKCFILRDWGFLIFGADLPDVLASFNRHLRETLVVSSEAGDAVPPPPGEPAGGSAAVQPAGGASGEGKGVLASAFRSLQARVGLLRTQSEPSADDVAAAAGGGAASRCNADKSQLLGGGCMAASEPSSPMIGSDLPDSIRSIGSIANRRGSMECRVPSFQTGFKPW